MRLRPTHRDASIAGFAVAALSVAVLPWYALDDYVPNGWDATWWARVALAASLAGLALASAGVGPRARLALAAVALAAVAYRLAVPPDFGFGFDGLDVPTDRRAGPWVAAAALALALSAELSPARRTPDSPRSGTGAAASASGPEGPAPA
jgi:peptidoglycan/LPS O-acetylase OafA/YrhL